MVFIKTNGDDVLLNLDIDTKRTTLSALKEEIGNKWIIQTMLQQLYLGWDYDLRSGEMIGDQSMRLRDDLCDQLGKKLSISQLGVEPWSTLLLVGPVYKPASFFESDDAVVITVEALSRLQLKRVREIMMEQEYKLQTMNNKKLKMA